MTSVEGGDSKRGSRESRRKVAVNIETSLGESGCKREKRKSWQWPEGVGVQGGVRGCWGGSSG